MDDSGGSLRLSRKAQRRAYLLNQLLTGEVTTGKAAALLGACRGMRCQPRYAFAFKSGRGIGMPG
jgi:hypothetical protein